MKKYIEKEKLVNEINSRLAFYLGTAYSVKDTNIVDGLNEALEIIDSLQQEQPEVDLEKEYSEFVEQDPVYSRLANSIVGKAIASHFYERGLNARKEE